MRWTQEEVRESNGGKKESTQRKGKGKGSSEKGGGRNGRRPLSSGGVSRGKNLPRFGGIQAVRGLKSTRHRILKPETEREYGL